MFITFLSPVWLLLGLLAVPLLKFWYRRQPTLPHTRLSHRFNLKSISVLAVMPGALLCLAVLAMSAAMARPALPHTSDTRTIETRDIIIAMDISGSMADPIHGDSVVCTNQACINRPTPAGKRKIDIAPLAIRYFVEQRHGDRVGLEVFDDQAYWHWPLTSDLSIIIKKTYILNQYVGGGTNFDGPTADGYEQMGPIQAAIDHFKDYGKAKSKVFVLVTDGGAPISPERFKQLEAQIKKLHIHMYVLGVGDDWTHGNPSTNDLRRFVAAVHGKLINAGNAQQLKQGVSSINALEKSRVQLDKHTDYRDLARYFILAAILSLFGLLVMHAVTRQTA